VNIIKVQRKTTKMAPLRGDIQISDDANSSATFPAVPPRRTIVSTQTAPIPIEHESPPPQISSTSAPVASSLPTADTPPSSAPNEGMKKVSARNRYATFSPKSSARLLIAAVEASVSPFIILSLIVAQKDDISPPDSTPPPLRSSDSSDSSLSNSVSIASSLDHLYFSKLLQRIILLQKFIMLGTRTIQRMDLHTIIILLQVSQPGRYQRHQRKKRRI
jgi:hypothetical protein